ncbi:MAG: UDP-N-acetylglucosamine 2-epimerase (non-hydrolyzing), partial [Chloroflexota bacterium]|nr:UDP-N-acetylglucosamine 2-epimerase (non-hydrolyzing) [Chloroflexota bacterium]
RSLRVEHEEILVHTGQHYDDAMSASFFRDLEIPEPDLNLDVGSGSHGAMTAEIMRRLEPVMLEHRPDGVLVYGDTNSTLAAAIVASKVAYDDGTRPWLAHVEAGLRSFNLAMPEERNRVVADHLADLLLAPTETAMQHLAREGLGDRATQVGDVMVDAFWWAAERADGKLPGVAREHPGYVLLTLHRPENVDDPRRLAAWIAALAGDRPVIFPVHPRTRAALERAAADLPANVIATEPAGYLEMVALERNAALVATDSGGVQKEAYLAGAPCVTLRTETEWVEMVEAGWNRLASTPELVPGAIAAALSGTPATRPPLYGDGQSAGRIVAAMERYAQRRAELGRQAVEATPR